MQRGATRPCTGEREGERSGGGAVLCAQERQQRGMMVTSRGGGDRPDAGAPPLRGMLGVGGAAIEQESLLQVTRSQWCFGGLGQRALWVRPSRRRGRPAPGARGAVWAAGQATAEAEKQQQQGAALWGIIDACCCEMGGDGGETAGCGARTRARRRRGQGRWRASASGRRGRGEGRASCDLLCDDDEALKQACHAAACADDDPVRMACCARLQAELSRQMRASHQHRTRSA